MDAADSWTDPLHELAPAEDAFQQARTRLKEAEADRYASIWTALTTAEDLTELRAMLPSTVTAQSLRAAVRRRGHPLHPARAVRRPRPVHHDVIARRCSSMFLTRAVARALSPPLRLSSPRSGRCARR